MLDLLGINQLAMILAAIAGGIGVVWGLIIKAGRDGEKKAGQAAREADNARARAIETAADRARRADDAGADPLGRLRDAGRLRK